MLRAEANQSGEKIQLTVSSILGFLAVQSFGLLYVADTVLQLDKPHLQTMMFLQLVAGGHLMLFLTRTQKAFWALPYPAGKLFWAIVGTQVVAVLMCGFGWLVPPLPWELIGWVWVYNLTWMVAQDLIKLVVYKGLELRRTHKTPFLARLKQPLDFHAGLHHERRPPATAQD